MRYAGIAFYPGPVTWQQRAASTASPDQTPLPSPEEKQPSPLLLWISKTLAIQTGWCCGGQQAQLASGHMGIPCLPHLACVSPELGIHKPPSAGTFVQCLLLHLSNPASQTLIPDLLSCAEKDPKHFPPWGSESRSGIGSCAAEFVPVTV